MTGCKHEWVQVVGSGNWNGQAKDRGGRYILFFCKLCLEPGKIYEDDWDKLEGYR